MQAVGMANDHLVTCYRLEECSEACDSGHDNTLVKEQEMSKMCGMVECVSLENSMTNTVISIS
jgi:DNA-3-methyladenine glycosylase I